MTFTRSLIPNFTRNMAPVLALSLAVLANAGCAQAGPASDMDRTQVEEIVRSYLLENPEIIREAMIELEKKEDRAMLASVSDALKNDPRDMSIGPKDAKVTMVEFFDYNCGFCKRSTDWVKSVTEKYPNDVRIVFKETPILEGRTKTSRTASKAALAAGRQGQYATLHFALMDARSLTKDRIRDIAKEAGLDMAKFDKDMKDPELEQHLNDTISLAQQIPPLTGTPFFVIGDQYIAGADVNALQDMLEAQLEGA